VTKKKGGKAGGKQGKGSDDQPKAPKIPKKQAKKWNLPPIPILIAIAVGAHLIYTHFIAGEALTSLMANPARGKELLKEGMVHLQKNNLIESLRVLDSLIAADPYAASAYSNMVGVLRLLGRSMEALDTLNDGEEKVIEKLGAEHEDLHFIKQGLYFVYKDIGQTDNAAVSIAKAAKLAPSAGVYINWAGLDSGLTDERKIELYTTALEYDKDHIMAFCLRYHAYALVGDWDKLTKQHSQVMDYQNQVMSMTGRIDTSCLQPYMLLYLNFSAEMMRETAKVFALREANAGAGERLPPLVPSQVQNQFGPDGKRVRKLRIGYVSSDLHNHPVGRNLLGMLLAHNLKKFDVYCFSIKHAEGDPVTATIQKTINYVDLTKMNLLHTAMAKIIREEYKIDVLIDLNGWTAGRRLQIFAARPAPVQMTHGLGFVGTTGVDAFDYFISDSVATPERFDHFYTEKVVRLPHAYLPASHNKVHLTTQGVNFDPNTANKMELRKEEGLPIDENVFVYCSFQSLHKVSKESFDTWMRILQSSPNSVLWFTTIKAHVRHKLTTRAKDKFGIESERLIFGESKNVGNHLIRAQACDLMLDSWPYNAHSTATDLLWAGVPTLVYLPD
jgi:predicted O-linked N-acetylglucosamine transferase (SPINDLY family)